MARYEFTFVVTDVELSDEHRQKVSQAVAEAGALALASATPPDAVTVRVSEYVLWRGIPPVTILRDLASYAAGQSVGDGQLGENRSGDVR
ncbi:MAG TPA: hypothetical protein VGH27_15740 [Streptosporangiaceae bacterium]|jgi:hypothetical protein